MLDEEEVELDILVELFYTWILDNKPHALTMCSLPDLAAMYCEERKAKPTDEFMAQFQVATYRFFDKISRVKPVLRPMTATKSQNGLTDQTANSHLANGGVETKDEPLNNENQDINSSLIDLTSTIETEEPRQDRFDDCDLSPPLIKTPLSSARRKHSLHQESFATPLFSPKS